MATEREQKLVDLMFEIAIKAADWRDRRPNLSNEDIAKWVSSSLTEMGFPNHPVGQSWGVLE